MIVIAILAIPSFSISSGRRITVQWARIDLPGYMTEMFRFWKRNNLQASQSSAGLGMSDSWEQ